MQVTMNHLRLTIGQTRETKKIKKLSADVSTLTNKVSVLSESLEKYKADELFDSLEDLGDPYPLLSKLEPDEVMLTYFVLLLIGYV